ncbi:MAG: hypothetical protein JWP77_2133 [Polaromonas sp.]|nr:hypothetical protein [Polaromonas sp.]
MHLMLKKIASGDGPGGVARCRWRVGGLHDLAQVHVILSKAGANGQIAVIAHRAVFAKIQCHGVAIRV